MGFFTELWSSLKAIREIQSQSLSGWDGVFHIPLPLLNSPQPSQSQSLSGWDGVFHLRKYLRQPQ